MRRQPWPERTGEVQCLGECLGKAGRLRFEPDIARLRAEAAGVNGAIVFRPRAPHASATPGGNAIEQWIDFFEALRNYHSTVDPALLQGLRAAALAPFAPLRLFGTLAAHSPELDHGSWHWQHRRRWFPQGIKRERGACA
jgi:hypothetical protein